MSFNIDGIGLEGEPTPPKTIEGETSRIVQRMLQTGITYADRIPDKIYMYFQLKDQSAVLDLIFWIDGKLYDMINLNDAGVMDEVAIEDLLEVEENSETTKITENEDEDSLNENSEDATSTPVKVSIQGSSFVKPVNDLTEDEETQETQTKLVPHVFDVSEEKQTQLMGFMSQGISEFVETYKSFNRMLPDQVWGSVDLTDGNNIKVKASIGYLPVGSVFPTVSDVTAAWKSELEALDEKFFDMLTEVPTNDEIFYNMLKAKEEKKTDEL